MYNKLQKRFMLVSTLVLLAVITLVSGAVYWIASSAVMAQTRVLMALILENDGALPGRSEFDAQQATFLALSPESLNEARYFSARVTDGEAELVSSAHISSVSEEYALELAERVCAQRRAWGRVSTPERSVLHFETRSEDGGATLIVFLDSTSRYGLIRLILMYMCALWFAVLVLYVVIMGRYSRKLVKPFVDNDERQKRFITNASHELKTPLAVISANTEMTELLGGKSKWTESTRRQLGRLQSLIEDLVVLSRLNEMKDVAMEDVDVSAAASEAAESFRGVVEGGGKAFMSNISPGIVVRTDKRGLNQIASILLDNAAKYCDEGGTVTLSLTPRARGRGARLCVANTYAEGGQVDYSRFFERFYRQDESHNSERSGFGIGLSMAREIAERMKARLRVDYAGDTIRFTLEL